MSEDEEGNILYLNDKSRSMHRELSKGGKDTEKRLEESVKRLEEQRVDLDKNLF